MFFVYILKSKKYEKSYVGFTDNIKRRLEEHNRGKSFYTSRYKPWEVIYKEQFNKEKDAIEREKFFKTRSGRRKMKEIFDNLPGRLTVGQ